MVYLCKVVNNYINKMVFVIPNLLSLIDNKCFIHVLIIRAKKITLLNNYLMQFAEISFTIHYARTFVVPKTTTAKNLCDFRSEQ